MCNPKQNMHNAGTIIIGQWFNIALLSWTCDTICVWNVVTSKIQNRLNRRENKRVVQNIVRQVDAGANRSSRTTVKSRLTLVAVD